MLFDHTPQDGVAYVIIQHLSPDHRSFMAELLAKHSKLEILVAENGMYVEANRIYLMPQGKNMVIRERRLYLTNSRPSQPNTAIDIFLDALAEDQREKSIAVILSGTGRDGTKGIAAIKKNGGFVIAQDPESAKFDGMPHSAIESGSVDIVLPPEQIPQEIIAHLNRDTLEVNLSDKTTEKDEDSLRRILDLVEKNTPLDFSEYKRPTIIRRIVTRMTKNKIVSLGDYADFLAVNPAETEVLANEFLISVTKFFRDKEAFETIGQSVIPEIVENKLQVDTLKAWVVGCATGEEAYSLAMLIEEYLTERKKRLEVKIFASDVDKSALQHASRGVYPENIVKDVSEERLERFFIKQGDKYKIRENIRRMIIFANHDVIKQPPYGKIDLISCRNLLIYLNPVLQNKILASLYFCLNKGSFLFLGPSESLGKMTTSFAEVDKKWRIFKSIEGARNLRNTTYDTPGFQKQLIDLSLSITPKKNTVKANLAEILQETLLAASGYEAGVWVDADFEIILTYDNYEKYLLPKIFNFNLLEMLPEALSVATSTTLRKAVKSKKEATIAQVRFKMNEASYSVNVFVKPFFDQDQPLQTAVLVLFSDGKPAESDESTIEIFDKEVHAARYLEDLREEVAQAKQELKEAYDALEASNDNISSYNEELISSNEEMQSTNEELQSVNEELQTVNNEYQLKIKELAELNDDLNNYFKSTVGGQLYVDKDLVLRKFTPSAIKQINLQESDIGRLLSDISTNLRFSTLMDDISGVIRSAVPIEKEVQTLDERWYQMVVLPYIRQQDNRSDGVIITFDDITKLKKAYDKLLRINVDHSNFIYAVTHDLRGPLGNLVTLISFLKEAVAGQGASENEIIDIVIKAVHNLTNTIDELSDVAKIESEIDIC